MVVLLHRGGDLLYSRTGVGVVFWAEALEGLGLLCVSGEVQKI